MVSKMSLWTIETFAHALDEHLKKVTTLDIRSKAAMVENDQLLMFISFISRATLFHHRRTENTENNKLK